MAGGLSRNAAVLRYLLGEAPGIGRTQLLKFAYLSDCEARKYLGHPISTFRYVRYNHGPFDLAFYTALDELKAGGLATEAPTVFPNGYEGYHVHPTSRGVEFDFSLVEAQLLRHVAQTYLTLTARDLCDDVVYQTEPMQRARMNQELDMDQLNNQEKKELGFNLERLLASETSVAAGRHRPLADVVRELQARHNT
jgi:antitoxin SocA-like protein